MTTTTTATVVHSSSANSLTNDYDRIQRGLFLDIYDKKKDIGKETKIDMDRNKIVDRLEDLDIIDNGYRNSPYTCTNGDSVKYSGAPSPRDERERVKAVESSVLMVVDEDEDFGRDMRTRFDLLTEMCAVSLQVPMCLIAIVTRDEQVFKGNFGLDLVEKTKRAYSFCAWTLLSKDPKVLVVEDCLKDFRFQMNELVIGKPFVRFYAGAPIIVNGVRFGSFCVLDTKPRFDMTERDLRLLKRLAEETARIIEKSAREMYFMDAIESTESGVMLCSAESLRQKQQKHEDYDDDSCDHLENENDYSSDDNNDNDDENEEDDTFSIIYANAASINLLGFNCDEKKKIQGESLVKLFSDAAESGQIKATSSSIGLESMFRELLEGRREGEHEMKTSQEFRIESMLNKYRHVRITFSRKCSTFKRVQLKAKNAATSYPPRGFEQKGKEKSSNSSFDVIIVNITDITHEVNERNRVMKEIRKSLDDGKRVLLENEH